MNRRTSEITVIGYGLTALYATLFIVNLQAYFFALARQAPHPQYLVLTILFSVLCFASVAVASFKEWGRMALVMGNALLGLYIIKLYLDSIKLSDLVHVVYVLFSLTMLMYFNQAKIKLRFRIGKSKTAWKSILVIDDDETLIKIIRPVLISHGYSVLTANTGESGLQISERQKPDLILLDVILPGIKGRDVCRKLKDNHATKDIPIIFLTAKFSEDDILAEKAVGAIGHLTKPINANELISTVKSILEP